MAVDKSLKKRIRELEAQARKRGLLDKPRTEPEISQVVIDLVDQLCGKHLCQPDNHEGLTTWEK